MESIIPLKGQSLDLNEIVVFVKVVEASSFVGASRALEMPTSTVSRRISSLEARLGARLLHRTTRKVSPTDVGRAFYERCARVVTDAVEAEQAVQQMQDTPRGLLRVTTPAVFAHRMVERVIFDFMQLYPDVELDLMATDRVVDLVGEGFDVAVRAGELRDSSLIARKLTVAPQIIVATPEYLEARGNPGQPQDLAGHECLGFQAATRETWTLEGPTGKVRVPVRCRLRVNDLVLAHAAAVSGMAMALLPSMMAQPELQSGRLVRVLPDWAGRRDWMAAVYPSNRHLSVKVRTFIDHLAANAHIFGQLAVG